MSIIEKIIHMKGPGFIKNETQRYALFGALFGLTFPMVGSAFEILLAGLPLNLSSFLEVQAHRPVLWIVDTAPIVLGIFAALAGRRQDILMEVNEQLNLRERELQNIQLTLEQRVEERTHELEAARQQVETRASQLQTIAELSQTIALSHNPDELLPIIVRTVSEKFGFYHTGIFLLDEKGEYVFLRAANSEGGQKMLKRGHRLKAGTGIVGYVAQSGRPRIALDTGADAAYFNNPELPQTRSEVALPLKVGRHVIGVLDVQSKELSAFSAEDVDTLNTLANQVAITIENARLFEESQSALESFTKLGSGRWREFVEDEAAGYSYQSDGRLAPASAEDQEQMENYLAASPTDGQNVSSSLTIPVKLRDQVIGIIQIEPRDAGRKWSADEIAVVQSISERAALALENARLFEETSRRAEQQRVISQVTSRISESNNLDRILRTTVHELGRALGATRAFIQLEAPSSSSEDPSAAQPSAN